MLKGTRTAIIITCVLLGLTCNTTLIAEVDVGGYLKTFLISGETFFGEDYSLFLHRLRSSVAWYPESHLEFHLEADNQLRWGSYLDTVLYQLACPLEDLSYVDMTLIPYAGDELDWKVSLHRLYMRVNSNKADFSLGRQRIAWGTGRIWNPTDLFNPVSPLTLEPGEYRGADSVHVVLRPADLLQVEVAAAIGNDEEDRRYGARASTSIGSYEYSVIAGRFRERNVVGFDFTGYIGDAGFRGEFTWSDDEERDYIQGVLSYEYTFPNSLTVLAEYLYNGGNLDLFNPADLTNLESYDAITTFNRNFAAVRLSCQLHPLVSAQILSIIDLEDKSAFAFPLVYYSWKQNVDVAAGVQFFFGDEGDFSYYSHTLLATVSWYF
jgi:hypothetical protein